MENQYVCDEDLLDLCSTLFALLSFDVDVVYVQLQWPTVDSTYLGWTAQEFKAKTDHVIISNVQLFLWNSLHGFWETKVAGEL